MKYLSVSELSSQLKSIFSEYFCNIRVEGEITDFIYHQSSGHCYFSLKDEESSIKCVIFKSIYAKLGFKLESGLQVKINGNITLYAKRGEHRIVCTYILKSGFGSLQYEKLKEKFEKEGFFDKKYKKSIPKFPSKIALITSKTGAALADMKFVAQKRWNLTKLILFDTLVQGVEAKNQIATNIALADEKDFDIIVVARGGGSFEDLWAFNEEIVIRAIFKAKTPIVSAIGHEIDFVLSDFVADMRAPTPSACMEMILPDKNEWLLRLDESFEEINLAFQNKLTYFNQKLLFLNNEISHFKFDYVMFKNMLTESSITLNHILNRLLKEAQVLLNELKENITCKHLYLANMQDLCILTQSLELACQNFLKAKSERQIFFDTLNKSFASVIYSKSLETNHLKEMLFTLNPKNALKKGFVQITTQNGEIKELHELNQNDCIVLSNGETSKKALIQ